MGATRERIDVLTAAIRNLPSRLPVLWNRFHGGNPNLEMWHERMVQSGQKHLFVVMIERLGDIIACSAIARQIKEQDSDVAIAWVCSRRYAEVLEGNPYIDVVFHEESLAGWLLSRRRLRSPVKCLELFLDSQRCCWTGIKLPRRKSGINHSNYLAPGRNLLLSYAEAAGLSNITDAPPELFISARAPKMPGHFSGKPLLAVHFDSEDPERRLSPEAANTYVRHALSLGWAIVELGLKPMTSTFFEQVYFPGARLSINEHLSLLKSAKHFAGVDSAFLHGANAFQIPSTLFLGKFRHFDCFQTFSGPYFFSSQCRLVRGDRPPADFTPDFVSSYVPSP